MCYNLNYNELVHQAHHEPVGFTMNHCDWIFDLIAFDVSCKVYRCSIKIYL